MKFILLPEGAQQAPAGKNTAYLVPRKWDDWFTFETRYELFYRDNVGDHFTVGYLKIGQFDMERAQRSPNLKKQFTRFDGFSLGQDASYYETLMTSFPASLREEILGTLGDIAFDEELYERALAEDVTGTSLMRYVSAATVEGQFRRILGGGKRIAGYSFEYTYPDVPRVVSEPPTLKFRVQPGSVPPTNVHAIIGRNGVGKTFLLENLAKCLVADLSDDKASPGEVAMGKGSQKFAGITSVSWSAFDSFEPRPQSQNRASGLSYTYIGLKTLRKADEKVSRPKAPATLARDFSVSLKSSLLPERVSRWRAALERLASDPIFSDAGILDLARQQDMGLLIEEAKDLYSRLSSGHKIVLLTITQLVELVEERSLVLLDEPEAHLHPPLLSAFIRALSDLMQVQNGVAIVTTHSPVVLQEVPRRCAYVVSRQGRVVTAHRPETETFGENVGVLTHEVFGLEVARSGFHDLINQEAAQASTYAELVERFGDQLGSEGRAIARAVMLQRDSSNNRSKG